MSKYEPLHKIITYDNYEVIIKSELLKSLDKLMEKNRFITIKSIRIAVADIKRIIPAKEDKNILETMISLLSETQKNRVREVVRIWKLEYKNKELTEGAIINMIESIL